MALHFSANQYEKNFKPNILQNWEVPREYRERPRAFLGFTQIVANDRGHLMPGVKRNRASPWGNFVGTYDMPLKIPGNNMTNNTARTECAVQRLERIKSEGDIIIHGKLKQCKIPSPLPVKADRDADKTISPKAAGATTALTQSASGPRTGARAPEPVTSLEQAPLPHSPLYRAPVKPSTPNLNWPRPESVGGRMSKSASPNLASPKPLPPIASPRFANSPPCTQAGAPLKWPSPQAEEQPCPC